MFPALGVTGAGNSSKRTRTQNGYMSAVIGTVATENPPSRIMGKEMTVKENSPSKPSNKRGRTVHRGTLAALIQYVKENANVVLPLPELESAVGLPRSSSSMGSAINRLMQLDSRFVRVGGGMYMYKSGPIPESMLVTPEIRPTLPDTLTDQKGREWVQKTPKPSPEVYEFVGNMGQFAIIRDEGSSLYVAIPLDRWTKDYAQV